MANPAQLTYDGNTDTTNDNGRAMFTPKPVTARVVPGGVRLMQPHPLPNPGVAPGLSSDLTRDLPDTYTTQYG